MEYVSLPSDGKKITFDDLKKVDENGKEYWLARELAPLLGYQKWQNFSFVIEKAKMSCKSLGIEPADHFTEVSKMVLIGGGAKREIEDIALSRYACYLTVQNGDPAKQQIARGQAYFAIQTRRQELTDQKKFEELSDDEKRVHLRQQLSDHNKHLSSAAHEAGIIEPRDYAIFQNYGYQGLYGGLGQKEIHSRKKLKPSHKILDYMGYEELAANLFRATQTESKLRRDKIIGKDNANSTHYQVGAAVRRTISELGGTMPENLPTPTRSVKSIERELAKKKKLPPTK